MLRIEHITKQFGDKIAVENLDMTVEDGSIMGLIGQNGAGKTTTFRMILDFIKSDSGLISWNGKPITQDVKQGIGFLPEERGLYQKMTVEEQILYFAELHGMKRDEARKELTRINEMGIQCLETALKAYEVTDDRLAKKAVVLEDHVDKLESNMRTNHIKRLVQKVCEPMAGIAFLDTLNNIERISDHASNIAQVVLEEI